MPRISIHQVYMRTAYEFAQLSYANRRKVGCIIVKNNQVISFGYNGTPHGFNNQCEYNNKTKSEVLHAESNAIMKVAKSTMSCHEGYLYTTTCPCFDCAKLIIQVGINKVYYREDYKDMRGIELLDKANVKYEKIQLNERE